MPYKKGGLAEQLGKLRRTAKRRIAQLEREVSRTSSDKERLFYNQMIDTLRNQISLTYQINPQTRKATGYTRDNLRLAGQNLQRVNVSAQIGRGQQSRQNFITQQELNMAESYHFIGPVQGEFTREEVRIFYRATQEAWENLPASADRNRAILDYYGETDLRSFVEKVTRGINREAVERAHQEIPDEYVNAGDRLESDEYDDADRNGSPDYLAWVIPVSEYRAASAFIKRPETGE